MGSLPTSASPLPTVTHNRPPTAITTYQSSRTEQPHHRHHQCRLWVLSRKPAFIGIKKCVWVCERAIASVSCSAAAAAAAAAQLLAAAAANVAATALRAPAEVLKTRVQASLCVFVCVCARARVRACLRVGVCVRTLAPLSLRACARARALIRACARAPNARA